MLRRAKNYPIILSGRIASVSGSSGAAYYCQYCRNLSIILAKIHFWLHPGVFFPRDAVLATVLAMTTCLYLSVCVSGFWIGTFLSPILDYVKRKFGYLQKQRYFFLELCSKLRTWFLPARHYASAGTSYGPVSVSFCLSVCLSPVGVLLKRLNESCWVFLHGSFL